MGAFDQLLELPGTPQERAWLEERLETLSVRESHVLAAVSARHPPEHAADAINSLQALDGCEVCLAGSYEELGQLHLSRLSSLPEDALPYVDFYQLGRQCEDKHPGLFVGNCYVEYPRERAEPVYRGQNTPLPEDNDWSVKLKLASPAVPEGVWMRLPNYDGTAPLDSAEVLLALNELRVESLDDCTLLDARCILPEVGNLMEQYDSITELVRDGDNLGYVLDEQGQGEPHWMEKFAAALEYEGCHTLRLALDISQNLHCYEWIPSSGLKDFAASHLRACGVSEKLLQSGCFDLNHYAEDLLDASRYMQASGETGYVLRNSRKFVREYTAPIQQDILKSFPSLEELASKASPEDAAAARAAISKALAGRGADGLRQLHAAMDSEDCASLGEAAEIAGRLDCYEFVEMGGFRESAEKELLEKGLDKRVIDSCIDFEAYAVIAHDFKSFYSSRDTGLYVHRNDSLSQQGQGMVMQ